MSKLYDLYLKVGNTRYGNEISQIAPYFSTINPRFVELRPGYCEIILPNTREVHNHLGTVHAIAMCNGAELVAELMTDVSIPEGRHSIPRGMTVEYLAKAKTDLQVVTDGENVDWSVRGDLPIAVKIIDTDHQTVFTASIMMNIK